MRVVNLLYDVNALYTLKKGRGEVNQKQKKCIFIWTSMRTCAIIFKGWQTQIRRHGSVG